MLLAHDPLTFKQASAHGVDLQLSGHTHGGQIWPFRYFVRLSTPYVVGHYQVNGAQLYVSRGTGFWRPIMRRSRSDGRISWTADGTTRPGCCCHSQYQA